MISDHRQRLHFVPTHANPFCRFATERGEAFNFHHIVSHSSADTLVGSRQAARLIDPDEAENYYKDAYPWVLQRQGWMIATPRTSGGGGPDSKLAASKTSGTAKKPPGKKKKPRTSGGGGELDRKGVPPKTSGGTGIKPRTSGGGGELDR